MTHFGFMWFWQLWCGLMTVLIVVNGTLDCINLSLRWLRTMVPFVIQVQGVRRDTARTLAALHRRKG